MVSMFRPLLPLAAWLAVAPVWAQQGPPALPPVTATSAVCHTPPVQMPAIEWNGQPRYLVKAATKDGRVVRTEVRALTTGVDQRAQRALVQAVVQALRQARCEPGEHVFEQTFSFDPPGSVASGPTR